MEVRGRLPLSHPAPLTSDCYVEELCFHGDAAVLAPSPLVLYTSDLKYTVTLTCCKYSNDTTIVAHVQNGQEGEYRDLVESFSD